MISAQRRRQIRELDFYLNWWLAPIEETSGEFKHGGVCVDGLGTCCYENGCGYDSEFADEQPAEAQP